MEIRDHRPRQNIKLLEVNCREVANQITVQIVNELLMEVLEYDDVSP